MRLLITGAAGFIGSALSHIALDAGHEVIAIDDMSRGLNPFDARSVSIIHDCQGGYREALSPLAAADRNVDAVVHLAAGTGSLDRPLNELRALNVEMTKRVYQDALDLGAKAFVFPTTSLAIEVPDSPYVISKEEAFTWLRAQVHEQIARVPVRFFNVIGAYKGCSERRKKEVHIIPRLVDCFLNGEEFVINGDDYTETIDHSPSRDFTNVVDVAETLLLLIQRSLNRSAVPRENDGATWVGTSFTTTALEMLRQVERWTGRDTIKHKFGPRRAYDCGELVCPARAANHLSTVLRRPLTPAWVGIRDEVIELLGYTPR
jgi:UDP-glucose 4-epimerase